MNVDAVRWSAKKKRVWKKMVLFLYFYFVGRRVFFVRTCPVFVLVEIVVLPYGALSRYYFLFFFLHTQRFGI